MRILMLGGTLFLGRHLVEAAQAHGHELTLFHRGKTNPDLFPDVEHLYGDRDGSLDALRGREWDAVIDTSGHIPRVVRHSAERLAGAVGHYTFISTIMVYAGLHQPPSRLTEAAPILRLADESIEKVTEETYGPLKACCEQIIEQIMPRRTLTIRPCIIVGPHDPTDRLTYWIRRIDMGGRVIALGAPDRQIQLIDVRDLAQWLLRMVEARVVGVYNASGPTIPFQEILTTIQQVSRSKTELVWVKESLLNEIESLPEERFPYAFPLWLPDSLAGFYSIESGKAVAAGLTFRPLTTTIEDTLWWDRDRSDTPMARWGLTPEQERRVVGLLWQQGVHSCHV